MLDVCFFRNIKKLYYSRIQKTENMESHGMESLVDELSSTEPVSDTIVIKKKNNTPFSATCKNCNKNFKGKVHYERHILQQTCYDSNNITYCKVCNITLSTNAEYVSHLMTMIHLNQIGFSKLDKLITNKPSTLLSADPYLTQTEAKLIGTNNLGESYTFVFENDKTQHVSLVHNSKEINTPAPDKVIQPTERQLKLLIFLEKQTNSVDGSNNLLKMLDNKLGVEDYHGLTTFIKEDDKILPEFKTAYLNMINRFVEALVKKKNAGQTVYKDKNIQKLVIALTM